jgi:hypothetical protein
MAAGSKPPEILRLVRLEAQHADGTGPGLEFRHGPSRPGSQGNDRFHERVVASIPERLATLARFNLQPPGSSPILQPANSRLVLLPAFAEGFTRERLRRHQQRRQFAQLQQSRLLKPWWGRRGPFLRRTQAITFSH